ncbi:DUF4383 domain-containing protein [Candidatus Woesearchaeota archaeon]|nr:DUF4383 domain-containing protein [Candidatus Woesearchaeota archaeon]
MKIGNVQKTSALILGIVLLVIGLWGLFAQTIIWFGVNILQSVLHLIAAGFGIWQGTKGDGKLYNMIIGWIGVALGVLGFVPGVKDWFLSLLNINMATTWLHLVIGVVFLGIGYGVKSK